MAYLRTYVERFWKPFLLAVSFVSLEALCDLMLPTLVATIIDDGVAKQDMMLVLRYGGIMLLITAVGAVAASSRNIIASTVSQRFGMELRSDLYRKLHGLSSSNLNKFDRASLITRMTNDITQVQNFMNGMMRIFVKAPLLGIGALIMAVRLDAELSLVFVVLVPLVSVLIALNMKLGFPRFMNVQRSLDKVSSIMREYLSGIRVVKAFNRFRYEMDKFDRANTEYKDASISVMRLMAVFNPAIMLTVNLGIICILWIGGLLVDANRLEVGTIVAFINYMTQILFALTTVSMVFNMLIRARASAARIGEVFNEENPIVWKERSDASGDSVNVPEPGAVEFRNVSFAYDPQASPALKQVSFSVKPGETVGIIGSTGSGKSTLVNLIPRFFDALEGEVRVNGLDVRDQDPRRLRERIAIVPQKTMLFSGTIRDNIRWGKPGATEEEVERAAKMAEAHGFISSFPEGYDTRLGQRGVNLSGGQKQRLAIARALIRQPDILILDDCTSAVDAETEARIRQSLATYARGVTCFVIAQRITSVMHADKIIVLDQGEVVGIGTHAQLLDSCRVYREIYDSQVGEAV